MFVWFLPYLPNFLPFLPIFWPLFSNFCPILRLGRTVWHKSMAHQLGRTELEKLAPPERILFWQNRIEFWQKEMVGPPSKMPQERLCTSHRCLPWTRRVRTRPGGRRRAARLIRLLPAPGALIMGANIHCTKETCLFPLQIRHQPWESKKQYSIWSLSLYVELAKIMSHLFFHCPYSSFPLYCIHFLSYCFPLHAIGPLILGIL